MSTILTPYGTPFETTDAIVPALREMVDACYRLHDMTSSWQQVQDWDRSDPGWSGDPYEPIGMEMLLERLGVARSLAQGNCFAICGHENRISYVVGWGHTYTATALKGVEASETELMAVQELLDEFVEKNRWHKRQQENQLRLDRDGEVFLRKFRQMPDGIIRLRYVEPHEIYDPLSKSPGDPIELGVQYRPGDVEEVVGYWHHADATDPGIALYASEIQHRKRGVDINDFRGVPLFYAARQNLDRANNLLKRMGAAANIQTSIAMIRRHLNKTSQAVGDFVTRLSQAQVNKPLDGRSLHVRGYAPGTILDGSQETEYEFPAQAIKANQYVEVLQAELRAVAAMTCQPEFMFSADASNANFASTMVAEGPAVRRFQRDQWEMIEWDREILDEQIEMAIEAGRLPPGIMERVEIQIEPPPLETRDHLQEAQRKEIMYRNKVLSAQTWCSEEGLDYEQEKENIKQHEKDFPPMELQVVDAKGAQQGGKPGGRATE